MNIGEPAVDAVVPHGESLVIDAELVQHGGVDVVDLGGMRPVERLEAPLVRLAVGAALDPATAEPVGEDEGVVVAAFAAL